MFEKIKEFRCYQAGDINDGVMQAMREFCPIYLIRQDDKPAGEFISNTQLKADYEKLNKLFQSRYIQYKDDHTTFAVQDTTDFKTLAGIVQLLLTDKARVRSIDMDNLVIRIDGEWGEGELLFSNPLEFKGGAHIHE